MSTIPARAERAGASSHPRAEVTGDRIVLRSAPSATTQERPARAPRVPALSAPVLTAPTVLDPRIPPELR